MNFQKYILTVVIIFLPIIIVAQQTAVKENIDGMYHMSIPERGMKNKVMQLINSNGTEMLAYADCEKCPPALLVYDKDSSEAIGKPVFTYRGFFLMTYDNESFVSFILSLNKEESFSNLNFYSKNSLKAKGMTKAKMKAYIESM